MLDFSSQTVENCKAHCKAAFHCCFIIFCSIFIKALILYDDIVHSEIIPDWLVFIKGFDLQELGDTELVYTFVTFLYCVVAQGYVREAVQKLPDYLGTFPNMGGGLLNPKTFVI